MGPRRWGQRRHKEAKCPRGDRSRNKGTRPCKNKAMETEGEDRDRKGKGEEGGTGIQRMAEKGKMEQYQEIEGERKKEEDRTGQGGIKERTGTGEKILDGLRKRGNWLEK
jgi:hypothetical protein